MHTVSVQEQDGSLIIAVPAELAEQLDLRAGATVDLQAEQGRIAIGRKRSKYSLDQLMSQCDFSKPMSAEEQEWLNAPVVGREVL